MSKKGTWKQGLFVFFSPILFILILRWALIEPFVIPSESMLPNLMVHDHVFVFKSSFGLRVPFTDHWVYQWAPPKRGDIIVFKYPENPKIYYVKRVIGVPGDEIKINQGRIAVNGTSADYRTEPDGQMQESILGFSHPVRFMSEMSSEASSDAIKVPSGRFFVMGDNRDNSSDSRVWGFVSDSHLVGRAWMIWLSCAETLDDAPFICDPLKMRWQRFFKIL